MTVRHVAPKRHVYGAERGKKLGAVALGNASQADATFRSVILFFFFFSSVSS